ncbi:MAG: HD domain-containing protein [Acidimicrobiales bacterium]|jgi:hypothetical protein|nr:HD domain-containing protein [Acidimicrobiales bacterium]
MAAVAHLARRFLGSMVPRGPAPRDQAWAEATLSDAERVLWQRMRRTDRRHAAGVARRVADDLGEDATTPVLAAALLHDVGKIESGLGTYGRVVATLSGMAVRHDDEVIRDWTRTRGFTRRVGLYLRHPQLGGDLLAMAGSDPLTEAWAREHHLPERDWTVPPDVGRALKAADDD